MSVLEHSLEAYPSRLFFFVFPFCFLWQLCQIKFQSKLVHQLFLGHASWNTDVLAAVGFNSANFL